MASGQVCINYHPLTPQRVHQEEKNDDDGQTDHSITHTAIGMLSPNFLFV